MFGRKTQTEYGVRFGGKDTWGYFSKGEAETAIKRMNKAVKAGGTRAKLIQRTVKLTAIKKRPKNTCSGGKCKRNGTVCRKHAGKLMAGNPEFTLKNIHKRWDEDGHMWS